MVFGTDGACVRIDLGSVLSAFAVFIGIVAVLQWIARRIVARIRAGRGNGAEVQQDQSTTGPYKDNPEYRHSAIRSARR